MNYERKPNTGTLWTAPRMSKSAKTGQDYTYYSGDLNFVCPNCNHQFDMWINAFFNVLKSGAELFSLSFKKKEPKQQQPSYEQSPDIQ